MNKLYKVSRARGVGGGGAGGASARPESFDLAKIRAKMAPNVV